MLLSAATEFNQNIKTRVRDSLRLVPVLKRKPKVLRHWLFSAHKEQIIIIALLALLPLAILPVLDQLLSKIFSPVTRKVLFGLINREQENPYLHGIQITSHWLLWIGTVLLAVYLYLRHLPAAMDYAGNIARQKEQLADQLLTSNPSESILLYNAARDWSCDEDAESQITSKLQQLNATMSQANSASTTTTAPVTPDGTVILTAEQQGAEDKKAAIAERYQIKKQLGAGAMGIVYQAEDLKLNRDVAIKQLGPSLANDAQLLARFRQEALALARLSHPNIVQVYDFIEWNDLSLIVMEFVEGDELDTWLSNAKPLTVSVATKLAMQMADALGYAHERGVVHRDFKPANVLISNEGKIKITDFGIAKLARSSMRTQMNTVMGSPAYMSPEQAGGDSIDHRTDIYALGIVLYQMLGGKPPFVGDIKSVIAQQLTKIPLSLSSFRSDIPPALDSVVQTMLAKQPADRYQSMGVAIEQLKSFTDASAA
jgi:hypothetical protein